MADAFQVVVHARLISFCRSCRAGVTVVLSESMPKVVESSGSGSSHRVKSGFTRTAAGKKE